MVVIREIECPEVNDLWEAQRVLKRERETSGMKKGGVNYIYIDRQRSMEYSYTYKHTYRVQIQVQFKIL